MGRLDLDFGLSGRLLTNRIISGAELNTLNSNNSMYDKHAFHRLANLLCIESAETKKANFGQQTDKKVIAKLYAERQPSRL